MDGSDQKLPPAAQTGYDTNLNQPNNNNNISQPNYSGGTQYLGGTTSTMNALSSATIGIQSTVPNTSIPTKSGTFQGIGGVSIKAPLGKVVESGQEHTGRWTKEEHEAFLSGLQTYGKEWKKVAARVKTRTVVQTRTHAQKYFQKLQKVLEVCSFVYIHRNLVLSIPIFMYQSNHFFILYNNLTFFYIVGGRQFIKYIKPWIRIFQSRYPFIPIIHVSHDEAGSSPFN